ncbi:putative nuclease with TOPRIM domain [Clostridium beijerinckii]|uniref:hypothetical protein n=1 Tax=Clostridium beijerinckii TaxID=1520 RepID=UPI0014949A69|nr:hypothetical protein [Clostridium beijerinckii]NOW92509.1 putative nuclease with TOPRIM domain [Clostridium beijerinckii]
MSNNVYGRQVVTQIAPIKLIDPNEMREKLKQVQKEKDEKKYRKEITTQLNKIIKYNSQISDYNQELVYLSNKLLNKVNSLDDTLLLLNSSFNNASEKTDEQLMQNNSLLLQLITLIEEKDEKKISDFMCKLTGTVGIELVVSYFKMKLGLTV